MSTTHLTAAEAASLSRQKDPAFAVETILEEVRKAAQAGEWSIKTYSAGFGDAALYAPENKWPEHNREALKRLRELGYRADVHAIEKQFVDLFLEVSWGPKQ